MPVKITLAQGAVANAAIQRLPENLHDKVAYRFMRIGTFLEGALKEYARQREKIVESLGIPKGQPKVTGEKAVELTDRTTALLEEFIEVPYDAVKVVDLQRVEGSEFAVSDEDLRPKIAPAVLMALDPFLVHPEEPKAEVPKKSKAPAAAAA